MSKEKKLNKIKAEIKKIKAQKELEQAKEKLKQLKAQKKKKEPTITSKIIDNISEPTMNITSGTISKTQNILSGGRSMALAGVRTPISDSEKMWVESWWENRKTMDPNFDIDRWFISSVHMDIKERNNQIEDFWTGRNLQNTENFWIGPSMWEK